MKVWNSKEKEMILKDNNIITICIFLDKIFKDVWMEVVSTGEKVFVHVKGSQEALDKVEFMKHIDDYKEKKRNTKI